MIYPHVLSPDDTNNGELERLKERALKIVDIYEIQLKELYEITYPGDTAHGNFEDFQNTKGAGDEAGSWVYYPWNGVLMHCVNEEDLFAIRTNRNKELINAEEQAILRNAVVGVAGMSVGAGMAVALAYSGISRHIKLADFDMLSTANLNRLREPLYSVGQPKVVLTAQRILELDPFSRVDVYEHGLKDVDLDRFFAEPDIDVIIDEIDDFKMKIQLRVKAKEKRIPLLMFTSLGDNILIDIERYDIDEDLVIFNNQLGTLTEEILAKKEISDEDAKRYAVQLVGQEYVPTRAMASLLEIGNTLVGRPQLYGTIAVDGGLSAYVVRQLLAGDGGLRSGRYFISFSDFFGLGRSDLEVTPERESVLNKILSK